MATLFNTVGVDTLLFDVQDVGARFYTFVWTLWDALVAAASSTSIKKVIVLDRPNPINGVAVEGPVLEMGFASFIGRLPIALRHGMTVGELASLFYHVHLETQQQQQVELDVVRMAGWARTMLFSRTGLPFVMPSPNMPTADTALVYPGNGIFEGTTMSEGRGTTRPFEIVGAGFLDWRFAAALRDGQSAIASAGSDGGGVLFRETYFTPTFSKFEGNLSAGVELYVPNPDAFNSVETALRILLAAKALGSSGSHGGGSYGGNNPAGGFAWVDGTGANFDLHLGTNQTRIAIEAGKSLEEIVAQWQPKLLAWKQIRSKFLLY